MSTQLYSGNNGGAPSTGQLLDYTVLLIGSANGEMAPHTFVRSSSSATIVKPLQLVKKKSKLPALAAILF